MEQSVWHSLKRTALKENCPQAGETWNISREINYYSVPFPCIQIFVQSSDNFLLHLLHVTFFPSRYWSFLLPTKQHKEVNSWQYKEPSAWNQYLTSILCPIPFRSLIILHCTAKYGRHCVDESNHFLSQKAHFSYIVINTDFSGAALRN